jgi:valyl-tRNA synthetase
MYRLMDTKGFHAGRRAPYSEEAAKAQAIIDGAQMTVNEIDRINIVPDDLRGLDRFEARKRVIDQITAEGLAVMVAADHPDVAWMKGQAPEWDETGKAKIRKLGETKKVRPNCRWSNPRRSCSRLATAQRSSSSRC